MAQKNKPAAEETGAPQPKEQLSTATPLSDSIPNAHAAGDGALGRGKDSLVVPDDAEDETINEEGGDKGSEPY